MATLLENQAYGGTDKAAGVITLRIWGVPYATGADYLYEMKINV